MKALIRSWKVRVVALGALAFALGALSETPKPAVASPLEGVCRRCGYDERSPYDGDSCNAVYTPGGYDCMMWKEGGFIRCLELGFCTPRTRKPF